MFSLGSLLRRQILPLSKRMTLAPQACTHAHLAGALLTSLAGLYEEHLRFAAQRLAVVPVEHRCDFLDP